MTAGHSHRTIRVREDGIVWRALTHPLLALGRDQLERVEASPYPYGVVVDGVRVRGDRLPSRPDAREVYVLTALGILHRWTGLTLEAKA